jgi:pimeloyl-ACP methyl ester carboxylesterase
MTAEAFAGNVSVHDVELYVDVRGAGEPLLLLHGFGGSSADWQYAGRDVLSSRFQSIALDARGHGRSTNPLRTITHRQCALDVLALLDARGIARCRAIGMSFGGNTLLHVATLAPQRVAAMVLVSATPYFPEQARAIMSATPVADAPHEAWQSMRQRHHLGDEQIRALWEQQRAFADSYDDVSFTPPQLSRITAATLIVYGDRDPLYPVELGVSLQRAIPNSALWVVPNAGHGPIFLERAEPFARTCLDFFEAAG